MNRRERERLPGEPSTSQKVAAIVARAAAANHPAHVRLGYADPRCRHCAAP